MPKLVESIGEDRVKSGWNEIAENGGQITQTDTVAEFSQWYYRTTKGGKGMRKGKSRVMIAGYVTLVCAVAFGGVTAAYLTHSAAAANNFVVGSQVSSVDETWSPPGGLEEGKRYTKKVQVAISGTADCYVRVLAEIADQQMADCVSVNWNQTQWTTKQADGYYYYKAVLPAGQKTEPLFTAISASADLSEFELIVYEETVQAAGSDSPMDAFAK